MRWSGRPDELDVSDMRKTGITYNGQSCLMSAVSRYNAATPRWSVEMAVSRHEEEDMIAG